MHPFRVVVAALTLSSLTFASPDCRLQAQEWISGVEFPEPPVVDPGETDDAPPSDAIVLFDGTDLSQWEGGERWEVQDGVASPRRGRRTSGITTKESFGDIQLHIEWSAPEEIEGSGQGRGNSGVFFMGKYEVQILDSYENSTYHDGQAASIYKQTPPMVNAMRKPGEWNTYDILFTAPKFRVDGSVAAGLCDRPAQRRVRDQPLRDPGLDQLAQAPRVRATRRKGPDLATVPRQPGSLPQHLAPRD